MDPDDEWGNFEGDENPASPALYSKGSGILYKTRDGAWVPGKVISVDISIMPPSYCIEVDGNIRETEEWRLKNPSSAAELVTQSLAASASPAAAPVTAVGHSKATEEFNFNSSNLDNKDENLDDDFGDFSAAPEPPPPPLPSFHSSPRRGVVTPPATSPKLGSPHSGGGSSSGRGSGGGDSIEKSFRKFLSVAAPNVAHVLEEQDALEDSFYNNTNTTTTNDNGINTGHNNTSSFILGKQDENLDDDFGDFADAPPLVPVPEPEERIEKVGDVTTTAAEAASSPFLRNLGASFAAHSITQPNPTGTGAPTTPHTAASIQEYGVAWTSLLTSAAEKLEQGFLFWATLAANEDRQNADITQSLGPLQAELLQIPRVQIYFAALGRIYYVASLVRLAAEMQGLLHLVQELESAWTRCYHAWTCTTRDHPSTIPIHSSTIDISSHIRTATNTNGTARHININNTDFEIKPLRWVSIEAAKKRGLGDCISKEIAHVDSVAVKLPTLSLDEFPRMLAWSEGLDSMLLLPLSVISDYSPRGGKEEIEGEESEEEKAMPAVVEWPEGSGRLCLSAVANFWLGCVSPIAPELE